MLARRLAALLPLLLPGLAAPALGQVADIAILSTTVGFGDPSVEQVEAEALGLTVDVLDAEQWGALSTAGFGQYRAIVLGDRTCSGVNAAQPAIDNRNTWGPAIDGNVVIVGTDPVFHAAQGGREVTRNMINFAVDEPGTTGAYISLGCYGGGAQVAQLLEPFGAFTVSGGTGEDAHIVAEHPALGALTDEILSNWGNSVHEGFDAWPEDFLVLVIADDIASDFVAPDGTSGRPYIVARGEDLTVRSDIDLAPKEFAAGLGVPVTLTATVEAEGVPLAGRLVSFEVLSGPNAGLVGEATTDANGMAGFTFSSAAAGEDVVVARFVDDNDATQSSNQAFVLWGVGASTVFAVDDWAEGVDVYFGNGVPGIEAIAYLAAQQAGVHVLDLSDPAAVTEIGVYDPGSCDAEGSQVSLFADDVLFVEPLHVLLVAAGPCGLLILDVEDPTNPTLIGSFDTPVWAEGVDVEPVGGDPIQYLAAVADFDSLQLLDISDPTQPEFLGAIDTTDEALGDGPVLKVDLALVNERRLAFAATGDGMRAIDVADPSQPAVIGTHLTDPDLGPFRDSQDVFVDPFRRIAVLPLWAGGLQIVDIASPEEPFALDTVPTPVAYYTGVSFQGLVLAAEGTEGAVAFTSGEGGLEELARTPIGPGGAWAWDLRPLLVEGSCFALVTWGTLEPRGGGVDLVTVEDCLQGIGLQGDDSGDPDGDGVSDSVDNCLDEANPGQADADADGYGDACDADLDNDGAVEISDLNLFSAAFGTSAGQPGYLAAADFDGDGAVEISDFNFLADRFPGVPGPSALAP